MKYMKKYRVWGYKTQGYYIDLEANNKRDARDKAMDVNTEDFIEGNDGEHTSFDINKKDIERIEDE
jgi:hypothetical protein